MTRTIFRKSLVDSIPVAMGYITMGFAAGVFLAKSANVPCPAFWSGFTALTSFSGTLQFLIVDAYRQRSGVFDVALLTLAISFRYALYGFSLLDRFRGIAWWKKLYLIHGLTDETYALEAGSQIESKGDFIDYSLALTVLNHCYWFFGTVAGSLAGVALPIPSKGIEFTMVALFIVIFTDQVRAFLGHRRH